MKYKIRKGVFETNSSSMHSICVSGEDKYSQYPDGVIHVDFGEFGWGYEELDSVGEKLSYVITAMQYYDGTVFDESLCSLQESVYYQWLTEMVRDYTGGEIKVNYNEGEWYSMGYIDHQSTDTLDELWSSYEEVFKSNMKELIFNNKYTIVIDNDNH